jgi:hypothetical protein
MTKLFMEIFFYKKEFIFLNIVLAYSNSFWIWSYSDPTGSGSTTLLEMSPNM